MEATILYRTDHHHSFASQEVLGVFSNRKKLLKAVKKIVKEDLNGRTEEIDWHLEFFARKGQTQGLKHSELSSEIIELNKTI